MYIYKTTRFTSAGIHYLGAYIYLDVIQNQNWQLFCWCVNAFKYHEKAIYIIQTMKVEQQQYLLLKLCHWLVLWEFFNTQQSD